MTRSALILLAAVALLAACARKEQPGTEFLTASYAAADALIEGAEDSIEPDSPIVYATFSPVGRLEVPTALGQMLAEQTASRLVQRGYPVVEVRLREGIAVKPGGPFVLSDDAQEVAERVLAEAALVGSYVAATDYVLLNVRLIDVVTGIVLASHDTTIPVAFSEWPFAGNYWAYWSPQ
ncbi:FlgO family outer membrane protein [Rhodospirillaceae bacterium SYSU D60014]|uniref:FlgO family outer membrane protein n=1 Tax=Virgifigura deserti TaxID=2268457 RepID=UPI000E664F90